jgi:rubrerythrin
MAIKAPDSWNAVIHAYALAARLEEEGQYNLAKLVRAACDALTRQCAYLLEISGEKAELSGETMQAISAFIALGIDPQLIAGMQRGVAAMSEGRLPQIEETPDPYICRSCGYISMVRPTTSCPTCGAWVSTFQHHKPVYWLDALDPYASLGKLRQTPVDVAMLVENLGESQLSSPALDGGWSMRNIITHLFDAERVLQFRINLMLEQENPLLKSLAVFDWATNEKERPATTQEILSEYTASRQSTLTRLEAIHLSDWWRMGFHQEFGVVTVRQQASYFAMHEIIHLPSIARLRALWLKSDKKPL